jgi:3-oxoadipyl-CoA thiolase
MEKKNMRAEAFICDAIRTPIGRYGGALSAVRADDLAAIPIRTLVERNPSVDWQRLDDVILGCVNQAGEDNRNVARMGALLAGLSVDVPGMTVNRLCGSGMEAVGVAARAIKTGEADTVIAGGVESMTRSPFVMGKADTPFSRQAEIFDTTIGWRFPNPRMHELHGTDIMPETAENVAEEFRISREDQDAFAFRSQQKAKAAQESGRFVDEIVPVTITPRKGEPRIVFVDEHPRPDTTLEKLVGLKALFRKNGTVTAGNASGINDGAAALLLASEEAAKRQGLSPIARVVATVAAGVPPRIMGMGPAPATRKVLELTGLSLEQIDVFEYNEAFASQALAVLRQLGIPDDAPNVNPNGGAIALGHPLGMSGARLVMTAALELKKTGGRYALCAMCIGVGQGIAAVIERV